MFRFIFGSIFLLATTFASNSAHLTANDFNLFWLIPFIGILLSIALIPLIFPSFWHHHYGKVSAFWGLIFLFFFTINYTDYTIFYILEVYLKEFIPFIMLLLIFFSF